MSCRTFTDALKKNVVSADHRLSPKMLVYTNSSQGSGLGIQEHQDQSGVMTDLTAVDLERQARARHVRVIGIDRRSQPTVDVSARARGCQSSADTRPLPSLLCESIRHQRPRPRREAPVGEHALWRDRWRSLVFWSADTSEGASGTSERELLQVCVFQADSWIPYINYAWIMPCSIKCAVYLL